MKRENKRIIIEFYNLICNSLKKYNEILKRKYKNVVETSREGRR